MKDNLSYTIVDGIKCYSLKVAEEYTDYPDSGFDLTNENVKNSFWVSSRNRLFKRIVKYYQLPVGKTKFLEIGCGTGDFIKQIIKNEYLEITGSEIYLKGLQYAKKNQPDVNFIQLDVTQGSIGEQFDMIATFDVLEHIDNDVSALTNINKMLHKGGTLIVSVPQHQFLWSSLDEIVKHKRRYSRSELISKLAKNNFDVVYVTSFVFTLFPLMLISRLFDKSNKKLQSDEVELEQRVKFSSALNWIFDVVMRIDELLIRFGISLPFGGTLLVVAKKR